MKALLLALLLPVAACDYTVNNAARTLGGDVFCTQVSGGVAVCFSRNRDRGYVCFSSGNTFGQSVCLEGLAPQPEGPQK